MQIEVFDCLSVFDQPTAQIEFFPGADRIFLPMSCFGSTCNTRKPATGAVEALCPPYSGRHRCAAAGVRIAAPGWVSVTVPSNDEKLQQEFEELPSPDLGGTCACTHDSAAVLPKPYLQDTLPLCQGTYYFPR